MIPMTWSPQSTDVTKPIQAQGEPEAALADKLAELTLWTEPGSAT